MSSSNAEDLAERIAGRQAVVLVGAGVAIGATGGTPVAGWTGLLLDGAAHCENLGLRLPDGWRDRVSAQINSGDLDDLLSAAENIASRLGAPGAGRYGSWLRETVGTLKVQHTGVIRALADLGVPIATTNYDGLIEEVTGLPAVTWRETARAERVLRGDEPGVLHLHGHFQDPESVVLGIRSYEAVLGAEHAQTMQRALSALRTLVFVGFGAGLDDPNFGKLLTWVRQVFAGSHYRHYRLCLANEIDALTAEATPLTPLSYGATHADLAPFLRSLTMAPKASAGSTRLPPRPRCIGRAALVEQLVTILLADQVAPVPILGPPGIGKSNLSLATLHEPAVVRKFGARRWFVRCNGARGGGELFAEIVTTMGLAAGGDPRAQAMAELAAEPGVLVLDNGETPWEADRQGTQAALAELAGIPGLALVVSLRGRQRPFGVPWQDAVEVTPLGLPDARELFLQVAGRRFTADRLLGSLLRAQDGLPLTIELLACLAEGEPGLESVWRRWSAERHALISRGSLDIPLAPEVSFEVSINGPRMTETARRLLGLLAVLPDGIAHSDLDPLLPDEGEAAASTLRKSGLAFDEAGRLRALQPIREHVEEVRPVTTEDLDRLVTHWCELTVRLGARVDQPGGAKAVARLTAELSNIHTMLDRGFAAADPAPAVDAAIALSRFRATTGLGSDRVLQAALDRARQIADPSREAKLLLALGDIGYSRTDEAAVSELYQQALALYERIGEVQGQADCRRRLGNVALIHDHYDGAEEHFNQARSLYVQAQDPRGEADCVKALGDLALSRDQYAAATEYYQQARPIYQRIGALLGQANCTRRLGNVARKLGDHDQAGRDFTAALALFEEIGDVLGQANCVKGLGDVALTGGDNATAIERYQRANALYAQIGNTLGQATCVKFLGDAALARKDSATAVEFYRQALPLYGRIPQPYSMGTTYRRLARLTSGAEREQYLRAAREVWTGIGRNDMNRQLDEEFGTPAPAG